MFKVATRRIASGVLIKATPPLTNFCQGGSAAAAGSLVKKQGATLLGYVFILELGFLKGREKLDAPVFTLLHGQEGTA